MRRRLQIVTMIVALPATFYLGGCNRQSEAKAVLGKPAENAQAQVVAREQVPTAPVEQIAQPQLVAVTGSLTADERSEVASKRGGIVREVKIERGTAVKKGDELIILDDTDVKNRLAESRAEATELAVRLGITPDSTTFSVEQQPDVRAAKSRLELAEANYKRDTELAERKVIPRSDYDRTVNEYNTARQSYQVAVQQAAQLYQTYQTALTRIKTIQQNLADMIVRAPYDGMVAERHISTGESLIDGAKVATLVRTNPLRVVLNVPEKQVPQVEQGQKVTFRVAALPNRNFEGTVRHIGPSLEQNNRTLIVEAVAENPENELRPGFFVQADLESSEETTAYFVPRQAVRQEGESARLFVLEEGRAKARVVTLGKTDAAKVQVTSGLTGEETIIADATKVSDGVLIR